jgi:hypothetical protein
MGYGGRKMNSIIKRILFFYTFLIIAFGIVAVTEISPGVGMGTGTLNVLIGYDPISVANSSMTNMRNSGVNTLNILCHTTTGDYGSCNIGAMSILDIPNILAQLANVFGSFIIFALIMTVTMVLMIFTILFPAVFYYNLIMLIDSSAPAYALVWALGLASGQALAVLYTVTKYIPKASNEEL